MFNVFAACDKGYNGVHCKDRCAAPFYGSDCQFECKCEKENCHYAEGCKQTNKTGILIDLSCMMNMFAWISLIFMVCTKYFMKILM